MSKKHRKKGRDKKKVGKASKKIRKGSVPDLGVRQLEDSAVADPVTPGETNMVKRVIDPIHHLYSRKQIEKDQYEAAMTYRRAFDTLHGSIGGAMDPDKIKGPSVGSISLSEMAADAASMVRQADRLLGRIDGNVVMMVAGEGRTIEETTAILYGVVEKTGRPSAHDVNKIGTRLRDSLTVLAGAWHFGISGVDGRIRVSIVPSDDADAAAARPRSTTEQR